MSDPYVGEIRAVGFNFAPTGWALCNGQLLPISQNTALFSILGTNYGGDGKSTFGLPDLRGSFPLGQGDGPGLSPHFVGEQGGAATVTLLQTEMPNHTHTVAAATAAGTQASPENAVWGQARYGRVADLQYVPPGGSAAAMSPQALQPAGGSQPHNNMPPFLTVNFIIALFGIFPPRS